MANSADAQRVSPDSPGPENPPQTREPTPPSGAPERQDVSESGGSAEGHDADSVGAHSGRRRFTAAKIAQMQKSAREYYLRRRLTSRSYLDSPLTEDPSKPRGPAGLPRYRSFTEAERRRMQEYAEEYAAFVGPDFWKPTPIENVQGGPETDEPENKEQKNGGE